MPFLISSDGFILPRATTHLRSKDSEIGPMSLRYRPKHKLPAFLMEGLHPGKMPPTKDIEAVKALVDKYGEKEVARVVDIVFDKLARIWDECKDR